MVRHVYEEAETCGIWSDPGPAAALATVTNIEMTATAIAEPASDPVIALDYTPGEACQANFKGEWHDATVVSFDAQKVKVSFKKFKYQPTLDVSKVRKVS